MYVDSPKVPGSSFVVPCLSPPTVRSMKETKNESDYNYHITVSPNDYSNRIDSSHPGVFEASHRSESSSSSTLSNQLSQQKF